MMSKHPEESEKERLQRIMTSAFTYAIDEIEKITNNPDDLTILEFQITYNKKLNHVEILKVVLINNKKVILEPPVWSSHYEYVPYKYSCKDPKDRISIIEIPAQMPNIQKQIEKIKSFSKL